MAILFGGAIVGAVANSISTAVGNAQKKKEAEKSRRFAERMSNTAHQRAVKDMKRAGLNPILAAGQQASTPHSAMANPDIADPAGSAARLGDLELKGKKNKPEVENIKEGTKLTAAQTEAARAQVLLHRQTARRTAAEAQITENAIPASNNQKMYDESETGVYGAALNRALQDYPILEVLGTGLGLGTAKRMYDRYKSGENVIPPIERYNKPAATRGTEGYHKKPLTGINKKNAIKIKPRRR